MLSGPFATRQGQCLLSVTLEHLVAGSADLGAVLLQAGQDDEIALIDHRTAMALHVARAGLLVVGGAALRLGESSGRNGKREQSESQESFTHRVPSILTARSSPGFARSITEMAFGDLAMPRIESGGGTKRR